MQLDTIRAKENMKVCPEITRCFDSSVYRSLKQRMDKLALGKLQTRIKVCSACPTTNRVPRSVLIPSGDEECYFAFIGRNPTVSEHELGLHMHPQSKMGHIFQSMLDTVGINRQEAWHSTTMFCPTKKGDQPRDEDLLRCVGYKPSELGRLKNLKMVFLMGNDATRMILGPEAPSILSVYGVSYWLDRNYVFNNRTLFIPVLHPGYIMRNPDCRPLLMDHLEFIKDNYVLGLRKAIDSGEDITNWLPKLVK